VSGPTSGTGSIHAEQAAGWAESEYAIGEPQRADPGEGRATRGRPGDEGETSNAEVTADIADVFESPPIVLPSW
jgi:hypothetical protein